MRRKREGVIGTKKTREIYRARRREGKKKVEKYEIREDNGEK